MLIIMEYTYTYIYWLNYIHFNFSLLKHNYKLEPQYTFCGKGKTIRYIFRCLLMV